MSCITSKRIKISSRTGTIIRTLSSPSLKRRMMSFIFDQLIPNCHHYQVQNYIISCSSIIQSSFYHSQTINNFINRTEMQKISPSRLLKQFQSPQKINFLLETISHNKIKLSKQVYNLQTRNIKKFLKQQRQIQLKQNAQDKIVKKELQSNKKYDENQLLQLQYKLKDVHSDPVFIERCRTQPSEMSQSSRKIKQKTKFQSKMNNLSDFNTTLNNKKTLNRPKRVTCAQTSSLQKRRFQSSQILPKIMLRKKSKSTFEELNHKSCIFLQEAPEMSNTLGSYSIDNPSKNLKKITSSILKVESRSLSKKNLSVSKQVNEKLIEITDEKMNRYIRSLHLLVHHKYELGRPLNEETINNILIKRYAPKSQLETSKKVQITSKDKNKSEMFRFPFMEFISEAQTRKSIHRIINMSIKNTQNIVFKLLDFNGNGIIDQKDLIILIELSQNYPLIRKDFFRIARYVCKQEFFSISNAKSVSYREESQRQIQKMNDLSNRYLAVQTPKNSELNAKMNSFIKIQDRHQRSQTYSTSQMSDIGSSRRTKNNNHKNPTIAFNKDRLYSLLQSGSSFFNPSINRQNCKLGVNLHDFRKIFANQRPMLFYDIIQFMFHVQINDFINTEVEQILSATDKKIPKQQKPRQKKSGFKNYDVPSIIKDMENKFQCKIQMTKYQQIVRTEKV